VGCLVVSSALESAYGVVAVCQAGDDAAVAVVITAMANVILGTRRGSGISAILIRIS
jgi:hypothetical protein